MILSAAFSTNQTGDFFERQPGFQYWSTGLCRKGSQDMRICGDRVEVRANTLVIIPPDTPYCFDTIRESQEIWAIFTPGERLVPHLQDITGDSGYAACRLAPGMPHREDIIRAMSDMKRWWTMPAPAYDLAENTLERAFLLLAKTLSKEAETDQDKRIDKAIEFVHQNYARPIPVPALARVANLSTSRFAHVFKEREGIAPAAYIELYRMERARELLLSTDRTIGDIASATGFANQFHFSSRFKKALGQSPRSFRTQPVRDHHAIAPSRGRRRR